jgi:hypothetical protein
MSQPLQRSIREILLLEIQNQEPKTQFQQNLQSRSVLEAAARKLNVGQDPALQQAILTQWSELFRTGLLAWGLNLMNPNAPHFHITDRGRQALANATRDPSNPAGYLRHLASVAPLEGPTLAYLTEGLECYVGGLFRAGAVMTGAAAECLLLNLRDLTVRRLEELNQTVPKGMSDWRAKVISDTLCQFFNSHRAQFDLKLREGFDANWPTILHQIRTTRNDGGHPSSIDTMTPDTVHAALLVFPELARTAHGLAQWVANDLA